ncbi:MAG: prolyl oligopeptidase family serine peptidase [Pyrinomonadaceae bacterium]
MKNLFASFFLVCLFASVSVSAQDAKRALSIDDLISLKSVDDPQVSPDGRWVAYTVSSKDLKKDKSETRIWMVSTEGGNAIPLTAKGYSASKPRWSPDNKYLGFIATKKGDEEEKEPSQVYFLNRLGGDAEQITETKQGVSGFEWSPDSKRLMLVLRDPKPEELTEDKEDDKKAKPYVVDRLQFKRDFVGYLDRYREHLYVVDLADEKREPVQITSGDFDDSEAVWSPDGKWIAFVSNRSDNPDGNPNTDIWLVSPDNKDKGKNLKKVTTNTREDSNPAWSPDSKSLTYITVIAPLKTLWYATNHLASININGGEPTIYTRELDRNAFNPAYSEDGKSINFIIETSGEQQLGSVDVSTKQISRKVSGEDVVYGFSQGGGKTAALITAPNLPEEIYLVGEGKPKQLSFTNKKLLDSVLLSPMEKVSFKSKDGTTVEGFYVKPVGSKAGKKAPLILWNHGGPVAQWDYGFNDWAQLFAANGYGVLMTNPRGSSGYGQDYSLALFADWGNLDFQDAMAGVDYLIARGDADKDKLGVGGWSYGGILTNYVITQTDRFKGAVSGASEALFRANYGHDHYQMWWEVELGLPWKNVALWEKLSPFNNVEKITTPTLWMGGDQDWNVPILNSEQMYQAMKRLGRTTELVVYPGEFHGLKRPSFINDRYERHLAWYKKYVLNEK